MQPTNVTRQQTGEVMREQESAASAKGYWMYEDLRGLAKECNRHSH